MLTQDEQIWLQKGVEKQIYLYEQEVQQMSDQWHFSLIMVWNDCILKKKPKPFSPTPIYITYKRINKSKKTFGKIICPIVSDRNSTRMNWSICPVLANVSGKSDYEPQIS